MRAGDVTYVVDKEALEATTEDILECDEASKYGTVRKIRTRTVVKFG